MKKSKIYPWLVVLACALLYFCTCGMVTVAFSTHLPFIKQGMNITATETSLITTIRCLTTILSIQLTSRFYKRFSLRTGLLMSSMMLPVAYLIYAFASSVWMFYLGSAISGVVYGLGTLVPLSVLIRNWFETKSSSALSIVTCASGISTMVIPPLATSLNNSIGLRGTFIVEAIGIGVLCFLAFLIIRSKPEDIGIEPYREAKESKAVQKIVRTDHIDLVGKELIILVVISILVGLAGTSYTHTFSLHYTDVGFSAMNTALAVSVYGGVLIFGKAFFGILADKFGTFRINFLYISAWVAAAVITIFLVGSEPAPLYISAVLNGIGIACGTIGLTIWTGDLSSKEKYQKQVKMTQLLFNIGGLVGTPIPGIIADLTGNYRVAYAMYAVMLCLIFVFVQMLYVRHRAAVREQ